MNQSTASTTDYIENNQERKMCSEFPYEFIIQGDSMHDFMSAIGFSGIKNKSDLRRLIKDTIEAPTEVFMAPCGMESAFGGVSKAYADRIGLMVMGEFSPEADLDPEYEFPYIKGRQITTTEETSIEKVADKEAYVGVCDEVHVGVSLIFQLLNVKDYMNYRMRHKDSQGRWSVSLSGLSVSGKVILPIMKDEQQKAQGIRDTKKRNKMIAAARNGDQDAIENLTLEDIDLYTTISRRAKSEDILTIVESYFMPYGIAYDQYSVMGDILSADLLVNTYTGEEVWRMSLDCNDLVFDLCINKENLLGEPEVGRRFRGSVWLQGIVDFENELEN